MFLPENIDLAYSEKYNLSIRLIPNGFSFCIYCETDPSVFHFQETVFGEKVSYLENIQKLIFDYAFFTQPFKNTFITVVSSDYTIVPDAFFEKIKRETIFRFNFQDEFETVLTDKSKKGDFHIVYKVQEDLYSFLCRNIFNPQFTHHSAKLIPYFSEYKKDIERKRCFVDFHDNLVSVFCFDEEKLLSANTYSAKNSENTLYYIVSAWEQLSLEQMKDGLFLSGKTDVHKELIETLKKLIRNIEIVEIPFTSTISSEQKKTIPTDVLISIESNPTINITL